MSNRFRNNVIAVLVTIFILWAMVLLGGCSTTKVNRTESGGLDVSHTTWFIKTEAPSLTVSRDDKNAYDASFNADSRGGDIEAMAKGLQMLQILGTLATPVPTPSADGDG